MAQDRQENERTPKLQFFYTLASKNGELLLGSEEELDFAKVCQEALAALESGGNGRGTPVGLYEVYRWLHDHYGIEKVEAERYWNISTRSGVRPRP
jgi:hypothetical protein